VNAKNAELIRKKRMAISIELSWGIPFSPECVYRAMTILSWNRRSFDGVARMAVANGTDLLHEAIEFVGRINDLNDRNDEREME
jgi:hypothetical protein